MIFNSPTLDIQSAGINSIHFSFKGKLSEADTLAGIQTWMQEFDKAPSSRFELMWDCTNMTGFEMSARTAWMGVLSKREKQIKFIRVISSNIVIRGAAHLMLKIYNIPYEVIRSQSDALA